MRENLFQLDENIVFGIQGGIGSFNEMALRSLLDGYPELKYKIMYLYTTRNVLEGVKKGYVNYGLFAVKNSLGGEVKESAEVMRNFNLEILESITLKICHHLMKRRDIDSCEIREIMAHPQVFLQCKQNLLSKYPGLVQKSGEGNLIDTARAAQALSEGSLPSTTAILGPIGLSQVYGLDVMDHDLQDSDDNITTFLLVRGK